MQLRASGHRFLVLDDSGAHAHHLGERPERDAISVREAASAVPPDAVDQPVDVFLEFPRDAALADPTDADHRDQMRAALLSRSVKQLLDEVQLPIAAGKCRLELAVPGGPAHQADHPHSSPQRHRSGLAFQVVQTDVFVGDRSLGRAPRRLAHVHHPG